MPTFPFPSFVLMKTSPFIKILLVTSTSPENVWILVVAIFYYTFILFLVTKNDLFRRILNHIRHCPRRLGCEILYKYMVLPRDIYARRRSQGHGRLVSDDCGTPWICTRWTKDLD